MLCNLVILALIVATSCDAYKRSNQRPSGVRHRSQKLHGVSEPAYSETPSYRGKSNRSSSGIQRRVENLGSTSAEKLSLSDAWELFKNKFNKQYFGPQEETVRRKSFETNVAEVSDHNLRYYLGLEENPRRIHAYSDYHRIK